MTSLSISATAHGLNYLPEFYAQHTGIFEAHGLEVTSRACDPWTGVLDDLDSGVADLALGGLWVPAMYVGTQRKLTVAVQLNHQFPMTIVTRHPVDDFSFDWMAGKVVLAPGAGGSAPYEFTAGLMREAGVDPADTRFVRDLSTAMLVELYTDGLGDAIIADLGTSMELEAAGLGTISYRHLDAGIMPNSVYYLRTDRLEELTEPVRAFAESIAEAETAMRDLTAADLASVLLAEWPEKDQTLLQSATTLLLASQVWETVTIDEAASDRWMRILAEGGLVTSPPSYESLVDARFTRSLV